jgi:hypothetical protein
VSAVVAEWLRRLTRNQFPSGSVGSNPTDCEFFSALCLERMSLVLVLFTFHYNCGECLNSAFHTDLGGKIVHITHTSIVGSVVECSPATRAARVRFPDDAMYFVNSENKGEQICIDTWDIFQYHWGCSSDGRALA